MSGVGSLNATKITVQQVKLTSPMEDHRLDSLISILEGESKDGLICQRFLGSD